MINPFYWMISLANTCPSSWPFLYPELKPICFLSFVQTQAPGEASHILFSPLKKHSQAADGSQFPYFFSSFQSMYFYNRKSTLRLELYTLLGTYLLPIYKFLNNTTFPTIFFFCLFITHWIQLGLSYLDKGYPLEHGNLPLAVHQKKHVTYPLASVKYQ